MAHPKGMSTFIVHLRDYLKPGGPGMNESPKGFIDFLGDKLTKEQQADCTYFLFTGKDTPPEPPPRDAEAVDEGKPDSQPEKPDSGS